MSFWNRDLDKLRRKLYTTTMICYKIVLKTEDPLVFTSISDFKNHRLIYCPYVKTSPLLGKIFAFEKLEDARRMVKNMREDFRKRAVIYAAESFGKVYHNCISLSASLSYEEIFQFWELVESEEGLPPEYVNGGWFWYYAPEGTIYVDGITIKEQI